jgi:hypothetical protein
MDKPFAYHAFPGQPSTGSEQIPAFGLPQIPHKTNKPRGLSLFAGRETIGKHRGRLCMQGSAKSPPRLAPNRNRHVLGKRCLDALHRQMKIIAPGLEFSA